MFLFQNLIFLEKNWKDAKNNESHNEKFPKIDSIILNNITTYETNKNYYDRIKLDSYLATNKLTEACSFKDSLQEFDEYLTTLKNITL